MKASIQTQKSKAVSGTKEWSAHSVNIQTGCKYDCKFCFAKCMAVRFGRCTSKSWAKPVINKAAIDKHYGKKNGAIMFPTTHDITEDNLDSCLVVLNKMLEAGNNVLIVSKPRKAVIKKLCKNLAPFKKQVLFRFTITSANNKTLRYWEPGAPAFQERVAALKIAYKAGFKTSVSCEPLLDLDPAPIIRATRGLVTDAIWLGRVNRLRQTLAINCPGDTEARVRADQLLAAQSDAWVRDLYAEYKNDRKIKWKDSIKKVIGLARPIEKGLDI